MSVVGRCQGTRKVRLSWTRYLRGLGDQDSREPSKTRDNFLCFLINMLNYFLPPWLFLVLGPPNDAQERRLSYGSIEATVLGAIVIGFFIHPFIRSFPEVKTSGRKASTPPMDPCILGRES